MWKLRALASVAALVSIVAVSDARDPAEPDPDIPSYVGALFSNDLDGGHFCTASVVHSKGRNLIATAAHCLGDADGKVFAPGYHDGQAPYGTWTIERIHEDESWLDDEDEDADIAFATLAPRDGKEIEDVTGANTLDTDGFSGEQVTVTGYPSDLDQPLTCTVEATEASSTQQRVDCPDFTTGTSGSPWVTGDGRLVGVLGGYEAGGDTDDVSYSVVLGELTARLYEDATR
ncbi:trypsin-like peptidase domain-containing protein [Streptomyces sp. TRM66268-LWL]|uniref:Trypsin-like peptidase domain-containing protein n=1 Tax=Streptomyces polyasparticus TaxID=2767826 RepID=A0ABR7SV07_9ACTN|nr:trypsin-like peptidase domain-containing protein [Streptomyces polyasparticus]MBC9718629.1 trypsin-like peptidase domain-containing protein [Streptomyces polyasparticus]